MSFAAEFYTEDFWADLGLLSNDSTQPSFSSYTNEDVFANDEFLEAVRQASNGLAPYIPLRPLPQGQPASSDNDPPLELVWFREGHDWPQHFAFLKQSLLESTQTVQQAHEQLYELLDIGILTKRVYTCRVGSQCLNEIRKDPGVRLVQSLHAEAARTRLSQVREPHQIFHFIDSNKRCVVVWFREESYKIGQHFAYIDKILPRVFNRPLPQHAYCARLTPQQIELVLSDPNVEKVEQINVVDTSASQNFSASRPAAVTLGFESERALFAAIQDERLIFQRGPPPHSSWFRPVRQAGSSRPIPQDNTPQPVLEVIQDRRREENLFLSHRRRPRRQQHPEDGPANGADAVDGLNTGRGAQLGALYHFNNPSSSVTAGGNGMANMHRAESPARPARSSNGTGEAQQGQLAHVYVWEDGTSEEAD